MTRTLIAAAALVAVLPTAALADGVKFPVSLRSALAPEGRPGWELPAQISYINNGNGSDSYVVNAALSGNLPNLAGTTLQPKIAVWKAKNTQLAKQQDKHGFRTAIGYAAGDENFGYIPQFIISFDRDAIKQTDERTYQLTVDLTALKSLNLGGCGHALAKGCTYWDLLLGVYSNDVHSSANNTGLGRVSGARLAMKVTSNPFPAENRLAPLGFSVFAQFLNDFSASDARTKESRKYYKGSAIWKFYDDSATVKPSIALERVVGEDLLTGQPYQAYTQLAFRMEF